MSRASLARRRHQFLERAAKALGLGPADLEARLSGPRQSSVRIHRLAARSPREVLADVRALGLGATPIRWCPDAYLLEGDKAVLAASPLFQRGEVYIQNAASLLPVLALAPEPGDTVLDVCAAPGGKSCHVASLLGGGAGLWLNDGLPARVRKLRSVLTQFHVEPDRITAHAGQHLDKFIERRFDRILLDAQCSGEGMADLSHPQAPRYWSLARVTRYGRLQQRMLMAAFGLLRPGGVLVYSTCTFAPEENEAPVSHLLRHRADARIEPIEIDVPERQPGRTRWHGQALDPQLEHALRLLPSRSAEGFFVCRIRRLG